MSDNPTIPDITSMDSPPLPSPMAYSKYDRDIPSVPAIPHTVSPLPPLPPTYTHPLLKPQIEIKPIAEHLTAMYPDKAEDADDDHERLSKLPGFQSSGISILHAPTPRTAQQILEDKDSNPCLSLGDAILNAPLRGGIRKGITELTGEAGSGKTQLLLQLSLQVQLPVELGGLDSGALYIYTESGEFPIQRLINMIDGMKQRYSWSQDHPYLDHVFIEKSVNSLWYTLSHRITSLFTSNRIKLIIVDSITNLFRADYQQGADRTNDLLKIAAQLRALSDIHNIPVVTVNQVSDFIEPDTPLSTKPSYYYHWAEESSNRRVIPALGLTWAQCINTRIFLTRKTQAIPNPITNLTLRRFLTINLSSYVPASTIEFIIEWEGVKGVGDEQELIAHTPLKPRSYILASRNPFLKSYLPRHISASSTPSPPPSTANIITNNNNTIVQPTANKQVGPLSPSIITPPSTFNKENLPTNYSHVQFHDPEFINEQEEYNQHNNIPMLHQQQARIL